jgi:soluble lytic murein transglycosylase-like protein
MLLVLVIGSPAHAQSVSDWHPQILQASLRFGVPAEWIERVMQAESNGRTMLDGRPIRSRAGAIGLMQLMPGTWKVTRRALGLGTDPDDPRDNILAGTLYLRTLYDRFGYPGLFAAYNAGPSRYAGHLATGSPLPKETIAYLGKVGAVSIASSQYANMAPETVFAIQHAASSTLARIARAPSPASLFAVIREGR